MKKNLAQKIISSTLATLLLFSSLSTPALAALPQNNLSSETVLTQEATRFSVTVPTILPVTVDAQNNVTVATDVSVKNNSIGPVVITGITKTEKGCWSLVETPSQKVGKKEIKFDISTQDSIIAGGQSTAVIYSALTSPQKSAINAEAALDVVFTVGWDKDDASGIIAGKDKLTVNEETGLALVGADNQTVTWKTSNPQGIKLLPPAELRTTNPPEVITGNKIQIKALNVGTTTITATNNDGNSFTKDIIVIENYLQSIYIETQPTKTTYKAGDVFSPTGMVLKAVYMNGDEYIVPNYSFDQNPIVAGQTRIAISYTEKGVTKTTDAAIKVEDGVVSRYNITKAPTANGSFEVDKTTAVTGETVKVTTKPDAGYMVLDIKANGIALAGNTFAVADKDIEVSVTFDVLPSEPAVGTKYSDATYEYSYGQEISSLDNWQNVADQKGWGARLKNKEQSGKIPAPASTIQGYPVTNLKLLLAYSAVSGLSNFNSSEVTNMSYMFHNSHATSLDLSNFDTSKVANMAGMFSGEYSQITSLDLSYFNTSKITDMGDMFANSGVTDLDLSSFDTSKVTNMNGMFRGSKASVIRLSKPSSFTPAYMGHMFEGSQATSLDLSNFNTSNATSMNSMFRDSKATTINLSGFDTSNVTDMGSMFQDSQVLALDLSSFNTSNVKSISYMFQACPAPVLDLSGFDASNISGTTNMVAASKATIGYAKTQADADKFNASSYRPAKLFFTAKNPDYITISKAPSVNGTFTVDKTFVKIGGTVTIATKPDTGYKASVATVNDVPITGFSFVAGNKDSVVAVTFEPTLDEPAVGTKFYDDAFEYSYGQAWFETRWFDSSQKGWGVKSRHDFTSDGSSAPAASVQGLPVVNMNFLFSNNNALSIDLSKFDTSNVTSMMGMFQDSKATTIKGLSGLDTSNVTNMAAMFKNSKATTLDLSTFNTSNVTNMASMFYYSQANTLNLSNFDTSNVTNMNNMFSSSCATTINVTSFNTSNVTSMQSMFTSAKTMTLDVSSFDTTNVTNMFYMFCGSSATTLDLSSFNTSNVTNMGHMFNSSKATSIDLSSFDTSNVTDMTSMFYYAYLLTDLDLSSFDMSNVIQTKGMLQNVFYGKPLKECYARTQADANKLNMSESRYPSITFVVRGAPLIGEKYEDATYEYSYCQSWTGSSWAASPTQTGWGVRLKDKSISGKIPVPLSEIKGFPVTTVRFLFSGSTAEHVDLSEWKKTSITDASYMFANSKIGELTLAGLDTSSVTTMTYMFYTATTPILNLRGLDTSNVTNMDYMFRAATSPTIILDNINTENVTNMTGMFYDAKVKTLDLSGFKTHNLKTAQMMFYNCSATEVNVSNFDTSNVNNMANMFQNSKVLELDLTSFSLAKGVKTTYMFQGCQATVGKAKGQYEANEFNKVSERPKLIFVVPGAPAIGEKYDDGIYEYSYCQSWNGTSWVASPTQTGWGIMLKDKAISGKIPSPLIEVKGFPVTNASRLFFGNTATDLDLSDFKTTNITDMNFMFGNVLATSLDLSSFDTSKVENMSSMFSGCAATVINLSSFNTSLTSEMTNMFVNSKILILDLSSFDTSIMPVTSNMFYNVKSTKNYAKSLADATRFNNSTGKPYEITFTLK